MFSVVVAVVKALATCVDNVIVTPVRGTLL
jgi:hypothetical protein